MATSPRSRGGWPRRSCLSLGLLAILAVTALPARSSPPTASGTGRFAPVNRPAPAYTESASVLAKALNCSDTATAAADRETVLLVPGTFLDPRTNFDSGYRPALAAAGFPTCTVALPDATTGDAQTAGERIAYAVRTIAARTKKRVEVLGYSQGGLDPRFAFRFYPDTRALVDDFVALDPTNHGTFDADALCTALPCQPGVIQQAAASQFIGATNSGQETFAPIDYTVVYTRTDEVATPNLTNEGTSALHTGTGTISNIALQSVCPTDLSEHVLVGSVDNTAYQLALDAFTHAGPAVAARVPVAVCAQPLLPGVTPASAAGIEAKVGAVIARNFAVQPRVAAEPQLRSFTLRRH